MRRQMVSVLNSYWAHPAFRMITLTLLGAMVLSRGLFLFGFYVEDFIAVFFMCSLWLPFMIGVIAKRQLALPAASLVPGYRLAHIAVVFALYLIFILLVRLWHTGVGIPILTDSENAGVILTYPFIYLVLLAAGYFSVLSVIFVLYGILLVAAGNTIPIVELLGRSDILRTTIVALTGGLVIFLWKRMMTLTQENVEYPFIITWPHKELFRNQLRSSVMPNTVGQWLARLPWASRGAEFSGYPQAGSIVRRACHWAATEKGELISLFLIAAAFTPFYWQFVQQNPTDRLISLATEPLKNFAVFAVTPVVLSLCLIYKKNAYIGMDLMRPVSRSSFFAERGVLLALYLLGSWLVSSLYLAIIPRIAIIGLTMTPLLWMYFLLTGAYAFLLMAWIAYMATLNDSRRVIAHGVTILIMTQIEFMIMPAADFALVVGNIAFAVMCGILLSIAAWRRWSEMEF